MNKKTYLRSLLLLSISSISTINLFSQGTTWNLTGNNNGSSSTFIGTTTSQPLIFRTNNTERFRISQTGQFIFTGLGTTGTGFLTTNSTGQLQRTVFTGNANQVLLGNGTFGTLPSFFSLNGTNQLSTTFKLGVGVLYPTEMLEVNGNGVFNGTITTQKVIISDVAMASDRLLFRNSGMLMEGYNPADGTRNEIASVSQPLYINSMSSMFQNTIINSDNSGKVGIGTTSPEGKLDVNGNVYMRSDLFLPQLPALVSPNYFLSYDEATGQLKKTTSVDLVQSMYAFTLEDQLATCIYDEFPIWSNGYKKIFVKCPEVKVGIGTEAPSHSLTVIGDVKVETHTWTRSLSVGADENTYGRIYVKNNSNTATLFLDARENTGPYQKLIYAEFNDPTTEIINAYNFNTGYSAFLVKANGQITVNNGSQKIFQLEANGLIRARKIRVDQETWADFVFEENYNLMPINEVEEFVKLNKHLPNVPSEKNVIENGIEVSEMNKIMIQKIEELTLYLIEQNKKIESLEKQVLDLKKSEK